MVSAAEDKQMMFMVHVYFNLDRYSAPALPLVVKNANNKSLHLHYLRVFTEVTLSQLEFGYTCLKVCGERESATQVEL